MTRSLPRESINQREGTLKSERSLSKPSTGLTETASQDSKTQPVVSLKKTPKTQPVISQTTPRTQEKQAQKTQDITTLQVSGQAAKKVEDNSKTKVQKQPKSEGLEYGTRNQTPSPKCRESQKIMPIKRERTIVAKSQDEHKKKIFRADTRIRLAVMRAKTSLNADSFKPSEDLILSGNVSTECPSTVKIVRIFTSSTFTDTMHERNTLMKTTYPRLKRFCQERGYEFQVVDMRWGVREEATDDHMGLELCLKELELCQKLSTGPNFVSLLSHKYGYRLFPRGILATEFDILFQNVEDTKAKKLLQKWFQRDDNAVPPLYVLQSISTHLPDFLSNNPDKKNIAKSEWWDDSETMREAFEHASQALDPEDAKKYIVSVTEAEITDGLLKVENVKNSCVWLKRAIKDIEKLPSSDQLSRYIECTGPPEKYVNARKLLKTLKDEQMSQKLPSSNILAYDVAWTDKGINPETNEKHKVYLRKLSSDLESKLTSMIDKSIQERSTARISDPLFAEVLQHTRFCQEKCRSFHGRDTMLKNIENYLKSTNKKALVIHGESGCGKTSIVAMAVQETWNWFKGKATIVLRFLGTTPESSGIRPLLPSLTDQIRKIYHKDAPLAESLKELIEEFNEALELATNRHPLVVILDSIDQLDATDGSRQLSWFPRELPPNVKLIVSTLPEDMYEIFPRLKIIIDDEQNFLSIPVLPDSDVTGIVDKWLSDHHRTLTPPQRTILFAAFAKCPLPLFLKLSFDEACRWKSCSPKNTTVLHNTVRESIENLLTRMETLHGKTLVSRALGYLTAARSGLTEAELEDILSCDDDVLNDVYTYWTPPIRRLPPLLVVRLKTDLSQYLVDRGADGVRVMYWYHRQFIEAARSRYCRDKQTTKLLHEGLADFFSGTWSGGKKKPYTAKGESSMADRHAVTQPLYLGDNYNLRKIGNLPYHRTQAGQLQLLKTECLCSFEFLLAKLHATSLRQILDDYVTARRIFPKDRDLELISEALQLSQDALMYDPNQLAPQLLGRLQGSQQVTSFLKQCEMSSASYLYPDIPILVQPGGQLIHCLAGHQGEIKSLDLIEAGKTCVTCGDDDTVKFWDVHGGRLIRSIDGIGIGFTDAVICANEKIVLVFVTKKIQAISFENGTLIYSIKILNQFSESNIDCYCVAGPHKSLLAIGQKNSIQLYETSTGKALEKLSHPDTSVEFNGLAVGSPNYIALGNTDNQRLCVLYLKTKQFSRNVMAVVLSEDADEDEIEHLSEMDAMAISSNEKFLYISNLYNNNLDIWDIRSLTRKEYFPGDPNDMSQRFQVTKDGKYLYFPNYEDVCVWDLRRGDRTLMLKHPCSVNAVRTADWRFFTTISDDAVVRVWDISRKESVGKTMSGKEHKPIAYYVRRLTLFNDPRYILLSVIFSKTEDDSALIVYDVQKKEIVRNLSLSKFSPLDEVSVVLDNTTVIICTDSRKFKILDLDTLKVKTTLQGKSPKKCFEIAVLQGGKVAVPTRGQRHLKIYDVTSGSTVGIIKCCPTAKIMKLKVSKSENVLVVLTKKGPAFIYQMKASSLFEITKEDLSPSAVFIVHQTFTMTSDGNLLYFVVDAKPKGVNQKWNPIHYIVSWDTRKGKKCLDFVDFAYHNKYESEDNRKGLSAGVDKIELLDDNTLVTTHDDFIIRVWNTHSGSLLHHLEGHYTGTDLYIEENSPYFLSHGSWREEDAFRLWDKKTFTCIATYNPDKTTQELCLSKNGLNIIGTTAKPSDIIMWSLFETGVKKTGAIDTKSTVFQGTKVVKEFTLETESDEEEDPDDPDTDISDNDQYSDDDDDDDGYEDYDENM